MMYLTEWLKGQVVKDQFLCLSMNFPLYSSILQFLKRFYVFIFRQREREGERDGEKHQCVVASHATLLGTWPSTQACALTRNRTSDRLVHQAGAECTEPHQPGIALYSFCFFFFFKFLLLLNYSCMPFFPIPPPHPSQTQLPTLYSFNISVSLLPFTFLFHHPHTFQGLEDEAKNVSVYAQVLHELCSKTVKRRQRVKPT